MPINTLTPKYIPKLLLSACACLVVIGCGSSGSSPNASGSGQESSLMNSSTASSAPASSSSLIASSSVASEIITSELPMTLSPSQSYQANIAATGSSLKKLKIDATIAANYAQISLYDGDQLLLDNLDIANKSQQQLNALVKFANSSEHHLKLVGKGENISLSSVNFEDVENVALPSFSDISNSIGLVTEKTYKYGGPSIGDIDQDGDYDFVLNNHNFVSTQLVLNNAGTSVAITPLFPSVQDFHGSAVGDYDGDGDLDIMVALGGANGTSPTSYALLKNNAGTFVNVSSEAGINTPARGRSPRWVDFDLDGDLDLLLVNALTPNSTGPVQLFYRNNGNGGFSAVRVPGIEAALAERVLITDFNRDGKDDVVLYSPLTLWQGNGDFTFTDVSAQWLPTEIQNQSSVLAITDLDVDNDGRYDLYLARGKTPYQLANKSIDFDPSQHQLDVRDDGEAGKTLIDFTADGAITLSHLNLTYRQYNGDYPLFLGADKTRRDIKASGFQASQIPAAMKTAVDELSITQELAAGWPETRTENGIYIGYLGDGKWKAEWVRNAAIYWNVTFSLNQLSSVDMDWTPNNRNEQDILLINKGDRFVDASAQWNIPQGGNHWGATHGDFNNDGWQDLFVYRYGFLTQRVTDLLLLNDTKGSFHISTAHGAHDAADPGHGDMGQAFDFDGDGALDLLNGSEEEGYWYLYKNTTQNRGNYVAINVGYSPLKNIDAYSAEVEVTTDSGNVYVKRVGSAGEVFSQSLMNNLHFGLGADSNIKTLIIRWRNGEVVQLNNLKANAQYSTAGAAAPAPKAVNLTPEKLVLRKTDSKKLTPVFTPLNATATGTWASGNNEIVSVDANGTLTGNAVGKTTVSFTSSLNTGVNSSINVDVVERDLIYLNTIEISGQQQSFYVGKTTALNTSLAPDNADDKSLIWSSSNTAVASVDQAGMVTGVSAGSVNIVAAAALPEGTKVSSSVALEVKNFVNAFIDFDDANKYKTTTYLTNGLLPFAVNFHAGSGYVIDPAGIKFFLRELNSSWGVVKDIAWTDNSSVGQTSGSLATSISLAGVTPSADLTAGNFYFLFAQFKSTDGKSYNKGISPIKIANP